MIYLIGGPPKCGKTTLAKRLSMEKNIPWVSTDTLQCVIQPYIDKKKLKNLFPISSKLKQHMMQLICLQFVKLQMVMIIL